MEYILNDISDISNNMARIVDTNKVRIQSINKILTRISNVYGRFMNSTYYDLFDTYAWNTITNLIIDLNLLEREIKRISNKQSKIIQTILISKINTIRWFIHKWELIIYNLNSNNAIAWPQTKQQFIIGIERYTNRATKCKVSVVGNFTLRYEMLKRLITHIEYWYEQFKHELQIDDKNIIIQICEIIDEMIKPYREDAHNLPLGYLNTVRREILPVLRKLQIKFENTGDEPYV